MEGDPWELSPTRSCGQVWEEEDVVEHRSPEGGGGRERKKKAEGEREREKVSGEGERREATEKAKCVTGSACVMKPQLSMLDNVQVGTWAGKVTGTEKFNSSLSQSMTTSWNTRSIVGQIIPLPLQTTQLTSKRLGPTF